MFRYIKIVMKQLHENIWPYPGKIFEKYQTKRALLASFAESSPQMDKKKEEIITDPRIDLMGQMLLLSYRAKPDRWIKTLMNDDNVKMITKFLDDPNEQNLICTLIGGQFYVYKEYDSSIKQKYTHFFRKKCEKVTVENFRNVLNYGELSGKPIEDLYVMLNTFFIPMLNHPGNQVGWPETVKEDVQTHLAEFKNHVDEIRGAVRGETILPMPTGLSDIYKTISIFVDTSGESVNTGLKTRIENVVVEWTHICKDVLKENSKSVFADGVHPTPVTEIEFWQKRFNNFQSIYDQLSDPRVKKMIEYLELTKSPYMKVYKSLFTDVVNAFLEAKDISLYLKPLIPHIRRFEENDFLDTRNYIKPLIHVVGLIWAHSKYYAFPERIVTLFRQIVNLLIESVAKNLDSQSIFLGEAEDICGKITKTIEILELFLSSFEYVRTHLTQYYEKVENPNPQPWTFHRRTAFQRLLEFLDRLNLVKKILVANIDYSKLERVEVGGIKGKYLSVKCEEIFADFGRIYRVFQNVTYDALDIEDQQIHEDYKIFEEKCADIDNRLTSIFQQAFDECYNLDAYFKLINIIGNLMDRPLVRAEVTEKLKTIVDKMNKEVDEIKKMYDHGEKHGIELDNYYPPLAGRLYWYKKLHKRVSKPQANFLLIEHEILESEEVKYTMRKYDQMKQILDESIVEHLQEWIERSREEIKESLAKTQLTKDPDTNELRVNLDPKLQAVLREMRYLTQMGIENLPDEAREVFESVESIYESYKRLIRIEEFYNFMKNGTIEVEFDMIANEMEKIDLMLDPLLTMITWSDNDPQNIEVMYEIIKYLYDRVKEAQTNTNHLLMSIKAWSLVPIFERKDGKKENLLSIDDRNDRVQKRYDQINACTQELKNVLYHNYHLYFDLPYTPPPTPPSELIQKIDLEPALDEGSVSVEGSALSFDEDDDDDLRPKTINAITAGSTSRAETSEDKFNRRREFIKASSQKLKEYPVAETETESIVTIEELTQPPETDISEKWDAYLTSLDGLIAAEFINAVIVSQNYFLNEMGDYPPITPFLEVVMELKEPNIIFVPSVEKRSQPNFLTMIEEMLKDMYNMGLYMERIDPACPTENFFEDIMNDEACVDNHEELTSRIILAMSKAANYERKFDDYVPLWIEDRQQFLHEFLKYSRRLTPEEKEQLKDQDAPPIKEFPPTIAVFKENIDFYDKLYDEVKKLPMEELIEGGWLRIVVRPLRQAILNVICKWSNLFKQHLYNRVLKSLNDLEAFITESTNVMLSPLEPDDVEGLLKIMKYLFKVKEMMVETDAMFKPLKDIMDLLLSYKVEFPEEIHIQLQEMPDRWMYCKKVAATTKQAVAPLQAVQINAIKKRIRVFDTRVTFYRIQFKRDSIFKYDCKNVYERIDNNHSIVKEFEEEEKQLLEDGNVFDIIVEEFKSIKLCRKELKQIKQLWDYISMMNSCIDQWRATPWKKIDVEGMELSCKKFAKDLRAMDKETRGWDVFIQGEASIKNLLTSLRAVTELQNPAIRERHWQQLMQATKVRFVMSEDTTLNDLLALNLHEYEEEVKTIVDKSVKEMGMEKILKELNTTWTTMSFSHEPHPRTGVQLILISEELIETLEDNQSSLQNMMSSKFIDYFLEEVSDWQIKLSTADQVIQAFMEVQRKWMYLESIFIGSEDIRIQLPEDSKHFDFIDREFKEILSTIGRNLNVIAATNTPGLFDRLDRLSEQLTLCEKALNDYLETKRLAFPRFYFVSSADLLDILSNGNQPDLIQRHLTKLFDSLARLTFESNSKKAYNMKSKENDEYVKLVTPLECVGKVEIWLNKLIDVMRKTLRSCLDDALGNYEEKPRELWIFDYPAQPALCGTQIWWTTEVNMAFNRLEEGYENALKDYQKKQISQLSALINLLLGDLTPGNRQKIMTICTIDVHSRDVVYKMIAAKVENSQAFQWQSQLRHRWDSKLRDCFGNICDAQFRYQYEYLGNTPRLVITPLTDRCYITLTQSLHLIMGGAPAGPAGTGKTETTKDLGKALGVMVYVFNCSEQMDYKSIGNIYKGLAQTGCWGCFDEFNRISIEVLSVVAVQVKTIQDAIKEGRKKFKFLGAKIQLIPTIGIFITMNPGYAGRTELPENLKALFRPCAMVVPDFELICEIMLVAEGFQEARLLARKFITLYTLCRELLSKQDHYDWGLRAIKSVLVVAGALKRGDRLRPEDQVLMRALRDFNIPKIVTEDVPIFMGLIGDLFPALDVPRKRNLELEKSIRSAAIDSQLQPEEGFVLKIVQLDELLAVRHSVFIVGFTGTGKSMVWKTLYRTYQIQKRKPFYNDLNPKAVTNDELFGVINPATREWKDGLFSNIMRDQTNLTGEGPKWIVLDGDIDPMWIESLNTLMDDNKVLTLASNERIALTKHMRLLFEIATLRTATPATVSRAGILYINPADLGWNPYIASWIEQRSSQSEKTNLTILFDKYVPPCLESLRTKFKKITPISDIAHLQMLCFLLDCFLTPQNITPDSPKEWYEIYFVFAVVWAFGSCLFQDQLVDWRNEFSRWFLNEFKTVKFPTVGNVFSFYIDPETKKFQPWSDLVTDFDFDPDVPLQSTLVETNETTRIRFFVQHLTNKKIPVMLVGPPGSGKSVILNTIMENLPDNYLVTRISFNYYTTSELLQRILEKPLEKKAGRAFAPVGGKNMIYLIDDMNMPEVDKYFTVQPHTLIKQYMDYQHWYDRQKLALKDIHNVQFISSMNPNAGSFTIDPRLQRHFCVFAVSFPSQECSLHIYNSILSEHFKNPLLKFSSSISKKCNNIVDMALFLHAKVAQNFLPTAIKFHYVFTLRDVSNVFQGLLFSTGDSVKSYKDLVRLWLHETHRVYQDKMVDKPDMDNYNKLIKETVRQYVDDIDDNSVLSEPLIFCHFAQGLGDPKYFEIKEFSQLNDLLQEALSGYNDLVAAMNLVLFEDAMFHICRINRILESPRGNALLVGVGGSGKQSLTRLAAFISSCDVFQIQLSKTYSMADLRADLATLYLKTGLKSAGVVFLMSDAQVAKEEFLVLINDLLASGEISDLLPDEDVENVISGVRGEVKNLGLEDTRENCWKFFINRVRGLLKCVLCFSPVGATLRIRARKFPAIVNCVSIDWFHEWPEEALLSVSSRFLSEIPDLPEELVDSVAIFMSYAHNKVNYMSKIYLMNEKRYNYTTPKSFLEQIALYSKLIGEKNSSLTISIERLKLGLAKLDSTSEEVDGLKRILATQEVELKEKNESASKLISVLSAENEKVAAEQSIATEEEAKVKVIEEDVTEKQQICAEDLAKAEPALNAAKEALNTLNKNNLTELKSFSTPPDAVANVCAAVLVLFSTKGKIPRDRSWKACKVMMGKVDQFLNDLINYDKDNINPDVVKTVYEYLKDPQFEPQNIYSKSLAAAGLCSWVINIIKYHEVYVVVEPKRQALLKANKDLQEARAKLAALNEKLGFLEEKLSVLRSEFDMAITAKMKCQAEADATTLMIDLANRLVTGLGSERIRWKELMTNYAEQIATLPGDVLLISSFISYVGCFTRNYRQALLKKYWVPFLLNLEVQIPRSEELDPLSLLTDDALIAQWNNDGLPTDRMSAENACILLNSSRWPLIIDPQLQGINWVKNMYGESLHIIRLSMKNYLDILETCISQGSVVLLENIGETVDSVLEPILGRVLIKKGTAIKMGDKEVDFDPKFRLIIHTKLANPHYKPEIQAQTTLINFTVTRDGLEEQLLATVVNAERPELEELKSNLTKQENLFKITLKKCEDNLLYKLSTATGNILGDVELVENLETTKKTANEIVTKVTEAKLTSAKIDEAREQYRTCAARAALLYFVLNDLNRINSMYQFSLKAFSVVFKDAIKRAEKSEKIRERVDNLLDSITFCVYMYTSRGLFERDKLTFLAHMSFQILLNSEEIDPENLDFLLRFPIIPGVVSPVEFLTNASWGGIKSLSQLDELRNLDKDLEGSAKRWKKFVESGNPEREKYPGEWKNRKEILQLCMMRALRPDRMTYAVKVFVETKLGVKYITARTEDFEKSFQETSNSTPTFFILSPGVNPLKDVELLGKKLGFTHRKGNFHSVSLGQGQEVVAETSLDLASSSGHWVILENIHLVTKWLPTLEKKIEQTAEKSHKDFRLFLSAEPQADPHACVIPQGILETCIKITNEPPTGMFANLHKALDNFNQETLDMCTKESEFKSFLFALCYFHAVVAERRKFGPQGWNRNYPFNVGDLMISVNVLYNYLENNTKVPYDDLRYLFGEIMYGGHITDDWDRRLCRTYLEEYLKPELIEGEMELAPSFPAPPNFDYDGYHKYIDDSLPPESPYLYGLHPNAEIGFLTQSSEEMFKIIFELQPRDSGAAAGSGMSQEDKVKGIIEDILDKIPEPFPIQDMFSKLEDKSPFAIVALQECERMNTLCSEMRRSLRELDLGLKGELTITQDMEMLQQSLFMDQVPEIWSVKAYPSLLLLGSWIADLSARIKELENWVTDFLLPPAVWLGGFFNPQSFLTAIMQQTARRNEWPLDKMCLLTDVTKKQKEDFTVAPRDGAYVHGLFMEGARWEPLMNSIVDAKLKDLFPTMPVVYIRAITQDKQDLKNMYDCPVYKTRMRGPTFVWTFNLKTKEKASKWTLAGVALLLQI